MTTPNAGMEVEQITHLYAVGENLKWCSQPEKQYAIKLTHNYHMSEIATWTYDPDKQKLTMTQIQQLYL